MDLPTSTMRQYMDIADSVKQLPLIKKQVNHTQSSLDRMYRRTLAVRMQLDSCVAVVAKAFTTTGKENVCPARMLGLLGLCL